MDSSFLIVIKLCSIHTYSSLSFDNVSIKRCPFHLRHKIYVHRVAMIFFPSLSFKTCVSVVMIIHFFPDIIIYVTMCLFLTVVLEFCQFFSGYLKETAFGFITVVIKL